MGFRHSIRSQRRLPVSVLCLLAIETKSFAPPKQVYHPHPAPRSFSSYPKVGFHVARVSTRRPPYVVRTAAHTGTSHMANAKDKLSINRSLMSASMLVALDVLFRNVFRRLNVSFPPSLAGCGALFAALLLLPNGEEWYSLLNPGASIFAKWLPVFFVPSLVTLPLAAALGSALELVKVALVVVGGFYFSLLTTAWSVLGVRRIFSGSSVDEKGELEEDDSLPDRINGEVVLQPKAFSDRTSLFLRAATCLSAIATLILHRSKELSYLSGPFYSLFMLFSTLHNFVFGARLPSKFTKYVHPLVTCTSLTWLSAALVGLGTGQSFKSVLKSYRTGSLSLGAAGAGDVLLFLLGPAVVALACQMYARRKLMRDNMAEVGTAIGVSSFGGLFGTAGMVRILDIGDPVIRLSLLSRNITSPLAMAIASILGADVSLAVTIVVISGLIGANFGKSILNEYGVRDSVARGLGIGAAAHGLGTAAFADEEDAFPFAAIAMALTACTSTVLVSVPIIKKAIIQLALG